MKAAMKSMNGIWPVLGLVFSLLVAACGPGKGSLAIRSAPPGATVFLNGVERGVAPLDLVDLPSGQYLVELRLDGYEPAFKSTTLLDKQQSTIELEMQKTTGLLLVDSAPQGVDVLMDGVSKGKTPLLLMDLPLGKYKVDFASPIFMPRTMEVDLADRKPVKVVAQLVSSAARLKVDSDPSGAEVFVNGVSRGVTPASLEDLVAGAADVKVSKPGYEPYSRRMTFESTQSYEIKAELVALPSTLIVDTDPVGATVLIDGLASGTTPATVHAQDGTRKIEVVLMGYETVATNLVMAPNDTQRLDLKLVKNSGTLVLDTEPASVKVYINGTYFGTTAPKEGLDTISQPLNILLKAGSTHSIQLVREGYVAATFQVEPELDKIVTRHEALKRIFVRDTRITTTSEVINCRMEYKLPNGNIYYERFPGVFDTIKAEEVLDIQPIGLDDESNREARSQLEANRAVETP